LPLPAAESTFRVPGRVRVTDQVVDDLRDQLLSGALAHGERLPTERELADRYGVSGATIREALSALAAMGLIRARHGSGSYVIVSGDSLIATAISSVVRLERMGAAEVLGILGALCGYSVELACARADKGEIAELRNAAERLAVIVDVDDSVAKLKAFVRQLAAISHNPILTALCKLLFDLQLQLVLELTDRKVAAWKHLAGGLYAQRIRVVEALEARDVAGAVASVRAYHKRTVALIASSPKARAIEPSDPRLAELVSSLLERKPQ
jgi:GntR family transcriptional repressor for pyruvate dehydrogenase complex